LSLVEKFKSLVLRVKASSIIRDTLNTTSLGILGKGAGLLVPFFIAAWFGVSESTDVFFFVMAIFVLFSGIFAWSAEATIVSFVAKLQNEGPKNVGLFLGKLIPILESGIIFILLIVIASSKPLFSLITNFSKDSINLLCVLLLEISPAILFVTISDIFSGVLSAYKCFLIPAFLRSLSLVIVIGVTYFLKGSLGVHSIIIGFVTGEALRLFLLWLILHRRGVGPANISLRFNGAVLEFLKTSMYLAMGMSAAGLSPIINRTMASYWGAGSISVLEYAERICFIPAGIMNSGFLIVILSYWSTGFQKHGSEKLWKDVLRMTKLIGCFSFVFSIALFIFRYPLVSLVIGWGGKIPKGKLIETSQLLGIYLLGLIPSNISLVFGRAHLVLRNTKILMKITFIGIGILFLLNMALAPYFGLKGVALALVSSQAIMSLMLFLTLKKSLNI